MKLVQYNEYLVSTVDTDGHSSHSVHRVYTHAFPAVYGLRCCLYSILWGWQGIWQGKSHLYSEPPESKVHGADHVAHTGPTGLD